MPKYELKITHEGLVKNISNRFTDLSRAKKRLMMMVMDTVFLPMAIACAYLLDVGTLPEQSVFLLLALVSVAVTIPVFVRLGLYRAVIRYIGSQAVKTIFVGVTISFLLLTLVARALPSLEISLASLAIYWLIAVIYVMGSRFIVRGILQHYRLTSAEPILIYGAGVAGTALVWSLHRAATYLPVAFIDDDRSLQNSNIAGLNVYAPSQIEKIVKDYGIKVLLLAMPSISHRRRNEIIRHLESMKLRVQTIPDLSDIVAGKLVLNDLRDVDSNDLLGRDPVQPDPALLARCITGKAVMVTGAGGSIGSELCRQIVMLKPSALILLELSEVALFKVHRELIEIIEKHKIEVEITALLGNAQHLDRVTVIMKAFRVRTIYHAAAYKHVPIVEQNIVRGLQNNVMTTWFLAEAAIKAHVETFVLISTDKAVNPTNVMGATKRMAEMVLQGMQQREEHTRFCMVRFGNVLDSSGSVVPLFRDQIRKGGPLTVTHRDIVRYFMTIPEAVQLVIQAGSMALGGDVFVLDMGDPVRIYDLARRMIRLMGYTVRDEQNTDGDIDIVFTGLRPGEKLYEELLIGSNVVGTSHPMIMRATEHCLSWSSMHDYLIRMQSIVEQFDSEGARRLLIDCVSEYQPDPIIHDLVFAKQKSLLSSQKITEFRLSK